MYEAALKSFPTADAAIMCAAVADYSPEAPSDVKIKRTADDMLLRLKPNKDIAAALGQMKRDDQILVGFALETNDAVNNALAKMNKKNLDFIVLNSLEDEGAGFRYDTNKVTIIEKNGCSTEYDSKPKSEVADDIVELLSSYMQ